MGMSRAHQSNALTLEAGAGLALACVYSSSDEYVADIIQERRRAGAYGAPRRHLHVALGLLAGAIVVLACLVL
jgi:hypothetical protein